MKIGRALEVPRGGIRSGDRPYLDAAGVDFRGFCNAFGDPGLMLDV